MGFCKIFFTILSHLHFGSISLCRWCAAGQREEERLAEREIRVVPPEVLWPGCGCVSSLRLAVHVAEHSALLFNACSLRIVAARRISLEEFTSCEPPSGDPDSAMLEHARDRKRAHSSAIGVLAGEQRRRDRSQSRDVGREVESQSSCVNCGLHKPRSRGLGVVGEGCSERTEKALVDQIGMIADKSVAHRLGHEPEIRHEPNERCTLRCWPGRINGVS